ASRPLLALACRFGRRAIIRRLGRPRDGRAAPTPGGLVAILAAGRKIVPGAVLRGLAGNLAALGFGILVTLILAEIILRVVDRGHPYYSAPELYRPSDDPRVLFEPRPSFNGFSEGTWVTTNSRGLREREFPLEKPAGTRRVLFLGDSVTFGAGVRDDEPFARLLEPDLQADGAGPIQTLNAGVVGYNT